MSKQTIDIWGRSLDLDIVYDCYDDEQITTVQQEALSLILNNLLVVDNAKADVEKYCLQRNAKEIHFPQIDNIFKYVMPKSLYIQRTKDSSHIVAILCNYKFDMDNGLAIIFKNEKLWKIGSQDIIL